MKLKATILIFILIIIQHNTSLAQQSHLQQRVSISVIKKKMSDVLQKISSAGGFYFSYDSKIIKNDSLVTANYSNLSVQEILNRLFNNTMDYTETGNYIILRRRALVPLPPQTVINTYIIKGYIKDEETGIGISNASVYDKARLASALTDDAGYFVLKLKTKSMRPLLNISKENYYDTSIAVALPPKENLIVMIQNMFVPVNDTGTITIISPTDSIPVIIPDSTIRIAQTPLPGTDSTTAVEKTGLGKFFLSSKLKIQALNLKKFYTTRAYQVSLVPGLSTHGRLSSQVDNVVSLNVIGGYTGGTSAFEAGGVINIDRHNVQYVQLAGAFNIVGGNMKGLQMAGGHNHVLGNMIGLQGSGGSNYVNRSFFGLQASGGYNHVQDTMYGMQVSGGVNFSNKKTNGVQIAGGVNVAMHNMHGVQIAGLINYAKVLNGVQIGLVNISDSSNGYAIGLINFVKHGLHQLSFSTNEITNANVALKTGNPHLYSILQAGYNFRNTEKLFSYGYGIGTVINPGKKITLQPELMTRYLYTGDWSYSNILSSLHLNLQANISKYFAVYAAPAFNLYYSNQTVAVSGYKFPVKPSGYPSLIDHDKVTAWIGFSAGISLF